MTRSQTLIPIVVETRRPRRTRLRHLLPAAEGPHHLPRRRDRRRPVQRGHRPDALPGQRGPQGGHPPVHQLARAARSTAAWRIYDTMQFVPLPGRDVRASARRPAWRRCSLAAGAPGKRFILPHARMHDPPAAGRGARAGHRPQDRARRDAPHAEAALRRPGQAHRQGRRADRRPTATATTGWTPRRRSRTAWPTRYWSACRNPPPRATARGTVAVLHGRSRRRDRGTRA